MATLTASEARRRLFGLLDDVAESHEPLVITGKRNNGVLVREDDWRVIQETLHLAQIPGMVASIREGLETPPQDMAQVSAGPLDEVSAWGAGRTRSWRASGSTSWASTTSTTTTPSSSGAVVRAPRRQMAAAYDVAARQRGRGPVGDTEGVCAGRWC